MFSFGTEASIPSIAPRRETRRLARTACQVVAERGFRLLGERTLDVSPHGLLLATRALAIVGESVLISLRIPGGSSWIDAAGAVRRVLWQNERVHALAIEFEPLSLTDRALLQASLQRKPPIFGQAPRIRRDYAGWVARIAA
ncbi:MAG: PilZ domain-containing protein [Myxococcota bacterium]